MRARGRRARTGSGGIEARQMQVQQGGNWCRVRLLVAYGTWTQALHTARNGSRARLMEAQGG